MVNQGNVPVVFPPTPILDNWQPRAHLITSVTNNTNAVVQTDQDHGYLDGMTVTINVPQTYGMFVNFVQTKIVVLTANTFLTDIDTTADLPFVAPVFPTRFTPAQVTVVSGPFRNIAPIGI